MLKLSLLAAFIGLAMTFVGNAAELKPGDPAPDFSLPGSDGKTYKLSDFKGKRAVVVAWYPKAFTPGCTRECKSFREDGDHLKRFDVAYFTASCDTAETNKKFGESLDVDYPILSDADCAIAKAYGIFNSQRKVPNRVTFYIGKDGKILHVDEKVSVASHAQDVAKKLKELGVPEKK
jgi:peroxiredoxin Q/BCP